MELILKTAGVVFIALVIIAMAAFFLIRARLRAYFRDLGKLEAVRTPKSIHLVPLPSPDYKERARVEEFSEKFRRLGFNRAGTYRIPEMEGVFLEAFVNSEHNLYGIVYEHPSVGVFVDVATYYKDGSSITASNIAVPGNLDQREEHKKIYEKGAGVEKLVDIVRQGSEPSRARPASAEAFVADFEHAYADEVEWRASRGGPTEEEVRRIATQMEGKYSERQIREATASLAAHATQQLSEICLEKFLEQSDISASKWEQIRERVIVIHEKMEVGTALAYFSEYAEFPPQRVEEKIEECEGLRLNGRKAFERVNMVLPQETRFTCIGEVSEPVGADIYQAPEL